jgi:ribonucleoside-diphosphate reductase alpha chain
VSKGLTRSRTDKLVVMSGGVASEARAPSAPSGSSNVTAFAGSHAGLVAALREEPDAKLSPAERLEQLPWQEPRTDVRAQARASAAEKRAEAKAKGYEGEACGECGNFTLLRNGTCLKCDTCGSTTGCS